MDTARQILGEVADTDLGESDGGRPLTPESLAPVIRPVGESAVAPRAIAISLARAVVPSERMGTVAEEATVRVVPEVPGTVTWTNRSTLTFEPSEPFAPGTDYAVELVELTAGDSTLRGEGQAIWRKEFTTPELAFLRMAPTKIDAGRGRVDVDLIFTGPVSADAVGRWAYHCHLLFHMPGMMREVRVVDGGKV